MISLSRFDTGVYIPEYISVHSHALSEVNTTLSIALSIVSKSPNLGNVFLCISLRHIRNAGFLSRIYLFTHISLLINWTVNSPCQNYRYQIYALTVIKCPGTICLYILTSSLNGVLRFEHYFTFF